MVIPKQRESKNAYGCFSGVDNTQPTGWFVRGSWNSRMSLCLHGAQERTRSQRYVSGDLDDCPKGLWGKTALLPKSQLDLMWGRNRWLQPTGRTAHPLLWFLVLPSVVSPVIPLGEVLSKQRKPGEDAMWPLLPGPTG